MVELLEAAIHAAQLAGYTIRQDMLAGQGGGACTIRGKKWLFLDLAEDHAEQLNCVLDALRNEPAIDQARVPEELAFLLTRRKAA